MNYREIGDILVSCVSELQKANAIQFAQDEEGNFLIILPKDNWEYDPNFNTIRVKE
jgi:hypothetical protein